MNRTLIVLVAAALLGACGSSAATAGSCQQSSDCPTGKFCNASHFCQGALGCVTNGDCPSGQICDPNGECRCTGDGGCAVGEFCNAAQKCQLPSLCSFNPDCPSGFFCDTKTGQCIATHTCAQDQHCAAGSICTAGVCVVGCRTDGDCPLADYSAVPPKFVPYACFNGQCVQNGCHSAANCPAFYQCAANDQCQPVCGVGSSFCQSCQSTFFGTTCSGANSLCLTDNHNDANCGTSDGGCLSFCGLDCSQGQTCPQGTDCVDITEVRSDGLGGPGETCMAGANCPTPDGHPIRCPAQESTKQGVCPCFQDADCPTDPFTGNPIHCELSTGSCLVGRQCTPSKQYTCQTNSCGGG